MYNHRAEILPTMFTTVGAELRRLMTLRDMRSSRCACALLLIFAVALSACGGGGGSGGGGNSAGGPGGSAPTFLLKTVLSNVDVVAPNAVVFANGRFYFSDSLSITEFDRTNWAVRTVVGYTQTPLIGPAGGHDIGGPGPVTLVGNDIYFTNLFGASYGLVTANVAADAYESPTDQVPAIYGCCNFTEVAASSKNIYWAQYEGGEPEKTDIYVRPLNDSSLPILLATVPGLYTRARATESALYVNAGSSSAATSVVSRVNASTGSVQTIWSGPEPNRVSMSLGLSAQHVLWSGTSNVYESDLDGSNVLKIADVQNQVVGDPVELSSGVYVLTYSTDQQTGEAVASIVRINPSTSQVTVVHQENQIRAIGGSGSTLYWVSFSVPIYTLYRLDPGDHPTSLASFDARKFPAGSGPFRLEVSPAGVVVYTDGGNVFTYDPRSQTARTQQYSTAPQYSARVGEKIYFGDGQQQDILGESVSQNIRPWSLINSAQVAAGEQAASFEIADGKIYMAGDNIAPRQDSTISVMNPDGSGYKELYSFNYQPLTLTVFNGNIYWLCFNCGPNSAPALVSAPAQSGGTPVLLGTTAANPIMRRSDSILYILSTGNDTELDAIDLLSGQIAHLAVLPLRATDYSIVFGTTSIYLSALESTGIGSLGYVARYPLISWDKVGTPEIYLTTSAPADQLRPLASVFDGLNFYFWNAGFQRVDESQ